MSCQSPTGAKVATAALAHRQSGPPPFDGGAVAVSLRGEEFEVSL